MCWVGYIVHLDFELLLVALANVRRNIALLFYFGWILRLHRNLRLDNQTALDTLLLLWGYCVLCFAELDRSRLLSLLLGVSHYRVVGLVRPLTLSVFWILFSIFTLHNFRNSTVILSLHRLC